MYSSLFNVDIFQKDLAVSRYLSLSLSFSVLPTHCLSIFIYLFFPFIHFYVTTYICRCLFFYVRALTSRVSHIKKGKKRNGIFFSHIFAEYLLLYIGNVGSLVWKKTFYIIRNFDTFLKDRVIGAIHFCLVETYSKFVCGKKSFAS